MFPNKNPTAHGNGLSSDSASATATTLAACNISGLTGRTMKERPSIICDLLDSQMSQTPNQPTAPSQCAHLFRAAIVGITPVDRRWTRNSRAAALEIAHTALPHSGQKLSPEFSSEPHSPQDLALSCVLEAHSSL